MPVIDVHTHMFTARWLELLKQEGGIYNIKTRPDGQQEIFRGDTPVVIPQFAIGGGWTSEIALFNNGTSTVTGQVEIFDTNGNPMTVTLNNAAQSTFRYSIPAGGTYILAPRDANGQTPM